MTRNDYITKHKNLFWYTPENKLFDISDSFLVETILNYGSLDDVKELFNLLGIKKVAKEFFDSTNLSERRKNNYHELTYNYFMLLFNQYAH
ncbi:MAG: hypothetical protein JST29_10905 [Bacteroidetes bacterium]|nr:hypothetical protein [Bacteroidota bacterium]MBS1591554.1 hypothetical protein [Bacteroidota bacterium]